MSLRFAAATPNAIPISLISPETCAEHLDGLSPKDQAWANYHGFAAKLGQTCVLPSDTGAPGAVLIGVGTQDDRSRKRFAIGAAIASLAPETYALDAPLAGPDGAEIALGYLLSLYRYTWSPTGPAPQNSDTPRAALVAPEGLNTAQLEIIATGEALTRDLINTPAETMGPDALEAAVRALGGTHSATVTTVEGAALLEQNFPLIHTVGRAGPKAPRLIELTWGTTGPTLTLVGKGVCFDTGGLNLKPGASMGLMKKDMGGAATVLGLAHMIMASGLPLRLRVLIPAVENAVSASAFRPGDIFKARNGKTVEINNTDAEGRLVLADALALANETPPDMLICMATLTGAARVAVGPDLAPFYTDDDTVASNIARSAATVADPVWRMPFHAPYEGMIEPGIADLDNAPKGGFAGSITAALFLRRFVPDTKRFVHFDIYGWQPSTAPARPKGGVGQGARACFDAILELLLP